MTVLRIIFPIHINILFYPTDKTYTDIKQTNGCQKQSLAMLQIRHSIPLNTYLLVIRRVRMAQGFFGCVHSEQIIYLTDPGLKGRIFLAFPIKLNNLFSMIKQGVIQTFVAILTRTSFINPNRQTLVHIIFGVPRWDYIFSRTLCQWFWSIPHSQYICNIVSAASKHLGHTAEANLPIIYVQVRDMIFPFLKGLYFRWARFCITCL